MDRAARIKIQLKKKGMTQAHLCDEIGVRRSYIAEITCRKANLTEERLAQIAKVLDTTPEYLAFKTDDPSPTGEQLSVNEEELVDLFRKMNHHGQQQALDVVRGLSLLPENQKERDRSRAVTAVG